MIAIVRLDGDEAREQLTALAEVLLDCVQGNASVSFVLPFTIDDARAFFDKVLADVNRGDRILLGAFHDGRLVGTVQVVLTMPPNQRHRADVAKLLVLRSARGAGVGKALMAAAEDESREEGKTLLVLDTATGGDAEHLYERTGWVKVGIIPEFARYPDGTWGGSTIFWKKLE